MRILIVDDDEDIREVVGMILKAQGHVVDTAVNGIAALEALGRMAPPAVIIVDFMMPRLDGEDLVKAIRAMPNLKSVPILVMSGHHEAQQRAKECGASRCLVKPVGLDALLRAVHELGASSVSADP